MDLDTLGYEVSGRTFGGKVTLTKTSSSDFTQVVTGGKTSAPGWNVLWNSNRVIMLDELDPLNEYDDYSLIHGTGEGTNRNGKEFSVEIAAPLRREASCRWVSSGTLNIRIKDKKDRSVDYGNGDCDNKAEVTIDGTPFEFTLQ
jgi:hypothetical protein